MRQTHSLDPARGEFQVRDSLALRTVVGEKRSWRRTVVARLARLVGRAPREWRAALTRAALCLARRVRLHTPRAGQRLNLCTRRRAVRRAGARRGTACWRSSRSLARRRGPAGRARTDGPTCRERRRNVPMSDGVQIQMAVWIRVASGSLHNRGCRGASIGALCNPVTGRAQRVCPGCVSRVCVQGDVLGTRRGPPSS